MRFAMEHLRLASPAGVYPRGRPGAGPVGRDNKEADIAVHNMSTLSHLINQRPAAVSALGLPAGAALSLFVVGRTVGRIAHVIDQSKLPNVARDEAERYL